MTALRKSSQRTASPPPSPVRSHWLFFPLDSGSHSASPQPAWSLFLDDSCHAVRTVGVCITPPSSERWGSFWRGVPLAGGSSSVWGLPFSLLGAEGWPTLPGSALSPRGPGISTARGLPAVWLQAPAGPQSSWALGRMVPGSCWWPPVRSLRAWEPATSHARSWLWAPRDAASWADGVGRTGGDGHRVNAGRAQKYDSSRWAEGATHPTKSWESPLRWGYILRNIKE